MKMQKTRILPYSVVAMVFCLVCHESLTATEPADALVDATFHNATAEVADSVVQIRTVGGLDRIGKTQLSQGPLTGLIVSADGYIVSSAYNFAQQPSSILVRLPSGKQVPAELVARDLNRMLVLLKVETDQMLPVPTPILEEEMAVGQWAIALGRTFQTDEVDISLGIISALNRMHGRVVQTDANVSPANYGGPLVDIRGRVYGVLVPMSPQAGDSGPENALAGVEFYDSGIGFAVPLVHIFSVMDRWREGDDLLPGKMGVSFKSGSPYTEPPLIATVWPGSPAAEAGWKPNDTIIAVNGAAVDSQNQLQFHLKPSYAGDKLTFSLRRGVGESAEEYDSPIVLSGKLASYRHSFLGILPATSEGEGIKVEHVWPESPAAAAGIQPQDRITKIGDHATPTLSKAWIAMHNAQPGETIEIDLEREGEVESLPVKLTSLPEEILKESLFSDPRNDSNEQLEPQLLKLPEFAQEAYFIQPKTPEAERPGLVIWLGSGNEDEERIMFDSWQKDCQERGIILVIVRSASESGWMSDDMEYLEQLTRLAVSRFRPHPRQLIIAGQGKGGQLAYALAFKQLGIANGVIADNAPLPRTLKLPDNSPNRQLAVLSILPEGSTFTSLVKHDNEQLREEGYPVSQLERPTGPMLDQTTISAIGRWIAGLNRF